MYNSNSIAHIRIYCPVTDQYGRLLHSPLLHGDLWQFKLASYGLGPMPFTFLIKKYDKFGLDALLDS